MSSPSELTEMEVRELAAASSSTNSNPSQGVDPVTVLWSLLAPPTIDPAALARAVENVLDQEKLDWRTLQLVKEAWEALERVEGSPALDRHTVRKTSSEIGKIIRARMAVEADSQGESKFPSLKERLMPPLSPVVLGQFLRELGARISQPTAIIIGGAASLVLGGYLSRATEDVDLVDEVPVAIRAEHQLLQELAARYGLRVIHFQNHYLPEGWLQRTSDSGTFGKIHLRLVDPCDIIAGKLYSPRTKDLDDFRVLSQALDREVLRQRAIHGLPSRWVDLEARQRAIQSWYITYGEALGEAGS